MIRLLYIARYIALAVLLSLLLALAPAMAQNVVYQGETSNLAVEQNGGDTYKWELYSDGTVNFAVVPGNCPVTSAIFVGSSIGASVEVKWLQPGFYFFKVTASDITGCATNIKIGMMEVKPGLSTATIKPPDPLGICVGETATLEVNISGTGPWDITYTDGVNNWTVKDLTDPKVQLRVSPKVTTSYWITEVKNGYGTNYVPSEKVLLNVRPKPAISRIYVKGP